MKTLNQAIIDLQAIEPDYPESCFSCIRCASDLCAASGWTCTFHDQEIENDELHVYRCEFYIREF
jgi:hypothetical protein